jgi:hypothetical protein
MSARALAFVLLLLAVSTPARAAQRADTPYGIHSMVYVNAPMSFKEAMFREAAAAGASSIRVDISMTAVVLGPNGERDWAPLDEYLRLARRYRLQVVGVLLATPWWLTDCPQATPDDESYKCAASRPEEWGGYAGEIAARARGVIDDWEIINEPDGTWAYHGTPETYARTAAAAARHIHAANSHARVLMGGAMSLASRDWLRRAFATPGAHLACSIDVANVHIRGSVRSLRQTVRSWRTFFARQRVRAPLWVTEHGYPSDPQYQFDPAFRGGEEAQARYLAKSLPALLGAGAARVFVTERDNLAGAWASEGILGGDVADPPLPNPTIRRKLAADAVRKLARSLPANDAHTPRGRHVKRRAVPRGGELRRRCKR